MSTLERRFWAKVDKRKPDECWPWTASLDGTGYGQIGPGGKHGTPLKAHRVAVAISGREIPEGHMVHHACGVKACVNPAHLEVVSRADHAACHFANCERHGGADMRRIASGKNAGKRYCGACNREKAGLRRENARLRERVAELERLLEETAA